MHFSGNIHRLLISIHALLAESDNNGLVKLTALTHDFYPRSPCGERPYLLGKFWDLVGISIHALLAESDFNSRSKDGCGLDFYPRSPCGERHKPAAASSQPSRISIHALLAESDQAKGLTAPARAISIHALLAESDFLGTTANKEQRDFYPRSPCGERLSTAKRTHIRSNFYPRSPCGERRSFSTTVMMSTLFLSTLSLRRATGSGCSALYWSRISIHALLAESDLSCPTSYSSVWHFYPRSPCGERPAHSRRPQKVFHFYPRSPCGERHMSFSAKTKTQQFLSTLSLRRATECTTSACWG